MAPTFEEIDGVCDRCGKIANLRPFTWVDATSYRGKTIEKPWLCIGCFVKVKKQLWSEVKP